MPLSRNSNQFLLRELAALADENERLRHENESLRDLLAIVHNAQWESLSERAGYATKFVGTQRL